MTLRLSTLAICTTLAVTVLGSGPPAESQTSVTALSKRVRALEAKDRSFNQRINALVALYRLNDRIKITEESGTPNHRGNGFFDATMFCPGSNAVAVSGGLRFIDTINTGDQMIESYSVPNGWYLSWYSADRHISGPSVQCADLG